VVPVRAARIAAPIAATTSAARVHSGTAIVASTIGAAGIALQSPRQRRRHRCRNNC
jgi:hypothetical protein